MAVILLQAVDGRATLTTTTIATIIPAPGPTARIVVTGIKVTNASEFVATKVTILSDVTVKMVDYCPEFGGGYVFSVGGDIIFVGGINEAIMAQCAVAGAEVDVFVTGYIA